MKARVALLALVAGCSDVVGDGGGVVFLEVTPPVPPQVEVGDTIQLVARALDLNGEPVAATITWRTPDPANVFVDPATGRVAGITAGTVGRVQAVETTLASDFLSLTVIARADTVEVPDAPLVVAAGETVSPVLAPRVAARSDADPSGFVPVSGRNVILEIVQPVFADPAARTVEITGAALIDTVVTGSDGLPTTPVTLSRVTGATAPATVLVEVRVPRRSGALVPGSGQRFTVNFQ